MPHLCANGKAENEANGANAECDRAFPAFQTARLDCNHALTSATVIIVIFLWEWEFCIANVIIRVVGYIGNQKEDDK